MQREAQRRLHQHIVDVFLWEDTIDAIITSDTTFCVDIILWQSYHVWQQVKHMVGRELQRTSPLLGQSGYGVAVENCLDWYEVLRPKTRRVAVYYYHTRQHMHKVQSGMFCWVVNNSILKWLFGEAHFDPNYVNLNGDPVSMLSDVVWDVCCVHDTFLWPLSLAWVDQC